MKKSIVYFIFFALGGGLFLSSCDKAEEIKSTPTPTSIPIVIEQLVQASYVYGFGQTSVYKDIPDIVAIAVDSLVGFEGGHGGKTGFDTVEIRKSDVVAWPDTVAVGGYSISFQKFNKAAYKAVVGTNIVIAGPIPNPGPTDLEGTYKRTSNGVLIELRRVFKGVYVIDNPGGAGVPPFPYLLYNYDDGGKDKLVFPIQPNPCAGGLQLVGETSPNGLSSKNYTDNYPPLIIATSPLTLRWKIFEFPSPSPSSVHTGAALCQWGLGVRTFEKQ